MRRVGVDKKRTFSRKVLISVHENGKRLFVKTFDRGPAIVGRQPSCDLVLDFPFMSRTHFQIVEEGGNFFVVDLNSRNGLIVGDRRGQKFSLSDKLIFSIQDLSFEIVLIGDAKQASAQDSIDTVVAQARPRPKTKSPEAPSVQAQAPAPAAVSKVTSTKTESTGTESQSISAAHASASDPAPVVTPAALAAPSRFQPKIPPQLEALIARAAPHLKKRQREIQLGAIGIAVVFLLAMAFITSHEEEAPLKTTEILMATDPSPLPPPMEELPPAEISAPEVAATPASVPPVAAAPETPTLSEPIMIPTPEPDLGRRQVFESDRPKAKASAPVQAKRPPRPQAAVAKVSPKPAVKKAIPTVLPPKPPPFASAPFKIRTPPKVVIKTAPMRKQAVQIPVGSGSRKKAGPDDMKVELRKDPTRAPAKRKVAMIPTVGAMGIVGLSVTPGLSKAQAMGALNSYAPRVQSCYTQSLHVNPLLRGRMDFELKVKANGSVESVRTVRSSVAGGNSLGECAKSAFKALRFPAASNARGTTLSFFVPFGTP